MISSQNQTHTLMSSVSPDMPPEEEDIDYPQIDPFQVNLKREVKHYYQSNPLNNSFHVGQKPYEDLDPLIISDVESLFEEEEGDLQQKKEAKEK